MVSDWPVTILSRLRKGHLSRRRCSACGNKECCLLCLNKENAFNSARNRRVAGGTFLLVENPVLS